MPLEVILCSHIAAFCKGLSLQRRWPISLCSRRFELEGTLACLRVSNTHGKRREACATGDTSIWQTVEFYWVCKKKLFKGQSSYPVCGKQPNKTQIQPLGTYFTLNEVANDLVVEVLDGCPSDSFLYILLLKKNMRGKARKWKREGRQNILVHFALKKKSLVTSSFITWNAIMNQT